MRRALVVAAALSGACAPSSGAPAMTWTVRDLFDEVAAPEAAGAAEAYWGGFEPGRLAVARGPIPWRGAPSATGDVEVEDGPALVVQPAFADGAPAAVLITEIWDHHPAPWVQPSYLPVRAFEPSAPFKAALDGARPVLNVDEGSGFYSPFWRMVYAVMPEGTDGASLVSEGAVLSLSTSLADGPLVSWPLVPPGTRLARGAGEATAVQPLTGQPVADRRLADGWRDGKKVTWLSLGADHFTARADGLVDEVPLFAFVRQEDGGHREGLDLPFVLAHHPLTQSLARRVEVVVDASMAVFVPAPNEALRAAVEAQGLAAPVPDAAIPEAVARSYTLRVAADSTCFGDAARFPQECRWLDSQEAVEALPPSRRVRTETLVTAATLRVGDEVLR